MVGHNLKRFPFSGGVVYELQYSPSHGYLVTAVTIESWFPSLS